MKIVFFNYIELSQTLERAGKLGGRLLDGEVSK